jgi:hypothetical protein
MTETHSVAANVPARTASMHSYRVLLTLSALTSLALVVWVLWFCGFGIDFRDEGFYFVWMTDPHKYDYSLTQFGFLYQPLFELMGRSITGIRQGNLLATFVLAWVLVSRVLWTCGFRDERGTRLILAAAFATGSLAFLHIWLPTPSYNWLALQGLMIACTGLLLAAPDVQRPRTLLPSICIGIGGWLTFMAKPPSAAGLAICALAYLLLARKPAWRILLLSAAIAVVLLLGSAWVIDDSLTRFVDRYLTGMNMAEIMFGVKDKNSLLPRLGGLNLDPLTRYQIILGAFALAAVVWLAGLKARVATVMGACALLALGTVTLLIVLGFLPGLTRIENYRGLLLGAVPLGVLAAFMVRSRNGAQMHGPWRVIVLMLAMPLVYVSGTANDNWWQISHAAVFWVIAAALVAATPASAPSTTRLPRTLVVAFATQFIMAVLIQTGIEAPYGQAASLRDQHRRTSVGPSSVHLNLTPGFGAYLEDAEHKARQAGFKQGMPVLDLTGRSPTALYAMRASLVGSAWIQGGYAGSSRYVVAVLGRLTCDELAGAWVLNQPVNTTSIDPGVLASFGASLDTDYEVAATIVMDERFFGYPERWVQYLLKPRRSKAAAQAACVAARATSAASPAAPYLVPRATP